MKEKTEIELLFSQEQDVLKAVRLAKIMVRVYYQNGREPLPFDNMSKQNADGYLHYPGRYVRCEEIQAFQSLWSDYRMADRPRRGVSKRVQQEEAEELLRHISHQGNRFVFRDCDAIRQETLIDHRYFEDYFSMFCFLLAVIAPEHTFEGMRRIQEPTGVAKRVLTRVVYDAETLRFEQMEGLPVYAAQVVSWTRREQRFWKRSYDFPSIRVDILTDDRERIREDRELSQWLHALNQVDREMVSAQLRFQHPSFNKYPHVVLQAARRSLCVRCRDELRALMAEKGLRTRCTSILRPGECTGTELTIPDSVTIIGEKAFMNCASLRRVVIPEGVREIGEYAFRFCTSLEEVVIPKSVKKIDPYAFSQCPKTLVLRGKKGSAAERCAQEHGFGFEEL